MNELEPVLANLTIDKPDGSRSMARVWVRVTSLGAVIVTYNDSDLIEVFSPASFKSVRVEPVE